MIIHAADKQTLSADAYRISKPRPTWTPTIIRKSSTGQIKAIPEPNNSTRR